MIARKLLEHSGSLVAANSREIALYQDNRRRLLDGLRRRFAGGPVRWNVPDGGFFVVLTVPFEVDDEVLELSARRFGVVWTPMHHFFDGIRSTRQIRLSCSLLTPERIELGLDRLARLIADRVSDRTGC